MGDTERRAELAQEAEEAEARAEAEERGEVEPLPSFRTREFREQLERGMPLAAPSGGFPWRDWLIEQLGLAGIEVNDAVTDDLLWGMWQDACDVGLLPVTGRVRVPPGPAPDVDGLDGFGEWIRRSSGLAAGVEPAGDAALAADTKATGDEPAGEGR